jgi:hypothetical protein
MGPIGNTADLSFRELRPTLGHFSNPEMYAQQKYAPK